MADSRPGAGQRRYAGCCPAGWVGAIVNRRLHLVGDDRLQVDEVSGAALSRYRVGTRLQSLPYATIHRAQRLADGEPVLVWKFGERYSRAAGFLEALQSLAGDDRAVGVPGVATVLDIGAIGEPSPIVYLVTQDAARGFLVGLLQSGGAPGVLATAGAVASALDGLHLRGLVHGDVQPATIAVDGSGRPLLVGQAVRMVVARVDPRAGWLELTRNFRPPESRQPLWPDRGTDLYGLAALTYYLLVGRPPDGAAELTPPSQLRPGLPQSVDRALLKALDRDPSARFATAGEFVTALRQRAVGPDRKAVARSRPTTTSPTARSEPGSSRPQPAQAQPQVAAQDSSGTGLITLTPLDPYEMDSKVRRRSGVLLLLGLVVVALVLVVLSVTGRISP